MIGALISLAGIVGASFKQYQERKVAEHEVFIAREKARKELAMAKEKAALELGKEQIKASRPWFKHFTFIMWFGPFIITAFLPEYGVKIFQNWTLMPEWYAQSCVALMFVIWGIQVGKQYIGNIFAGAAAFFKRGQELKFNRKVFYDALRSSKGGIGQHEVDIYEKAINAAQKKED